MKNHEHKVNTSPYKKRKTVQGFKLVEVEVEVKKRTHRLKEIGEFKNRADVNIILTNK
jgi:hypothetical protein